MGRRRWAWLLVVAVAGWLLWMTLRPNATVANDLAPLTQSPITARVPAHILIDWMGNVAVFVPLGVALVVALGYRPLWSRLALAILAGSGLSLAIELLQMALPSRVSAVNDWLLNTAGTTIGALAACWIQKTIRRKTA